MGDDFSRCKYTELDYTEHKIGGGGWVVFAINLWNTCSLSKDIRKKKQTEAVHFSPGGDKHREWKQPQLWMTPLDSHVLLSLCVQPWTPPRTRARMWSAAAIRCVSLRATRGPCVSIARNWSTGRWRFRRDRSEGESCFVFARHVDAVR